MKSRFDLLTCPLDGISLIEASAGTGKTWNICGLYLRLLLERKLSVKEILVVTFTIAATAELRARVRTRIVEALSYAAGSTARPAADPFIIALIETQAAQEGCTPAHLAGRLDLALQTFDEASIFTIHGFCQRALYDASFSAGLPFSLELVTDDGEMAMEAIYDFWRRRIADDRCPPELAAYLMEAGSIVLSGRGMREMEERTHYAGMAFLYGCFGTLALTLLLIVFGESALTPRRR